MATEIEMELGDFLSQECGEFTGCPVYAENGDFLIHYLVDEIAFARRLNNMFTVYLHPRTHQLVGYKIKGFKALLHRLGTFGVVVDGRNQSITLLTMVERALTVPEPDSDEETYFGPAAEQLWGEWRASLEKPVNELVEFAAA